jgi:RNA-directed DNA polymerase
MQLAPEPKDKLGAMTTNALPTASAVRVAAVVANGPGGEPTDWSSIDWRPVEDDVRRLRHRIFTAARNEDLRQVRNSCRS